MAEADEAFRREDLKRGMREILEQRIDARVERYLEVVHQGIVPDHHFAAASLECIDLYRDGYFLSAVMVSQSVAEGIWRFVLDRNQIQAEHDRPELSKALVERKILSINCAEAFTRIWHSFRNDVHHMNPKVAAIPFVSLARRNLMDLAVIEREIFGVKATERGLFPVQPKYWHLQPDGTAAVFLRNPWFAG